MIDLNELSKKCKRIALDRFNNKANVNPPDKSLKHCASEVVEAQEARDKLRNHFASTDYPDTKYQDLYFDYSEELADIIICVLIQASIDNIDIESALQHKIKKNELRAEGKGDKL